MRVPHAVPLDENIRSKAVHMSSGRGVGAYIQFLINGENRQLVAGEDEKCWLLSSGRVAKKKTEGSSWVWAKEYDEK